MKHPKSSKSGKPISKVNGANTQQNTFKLCVHYWNMNVLFSGGDNWYPAIIGSKAVCGISFRFVRKNEIHKEYLGTGFSRRYYFRLSNG